MRRARADAERHARRHGWSRRRFLLSSAGMASGLAALQACSDEQSASSGTRPGGRFTVPRDGGHRPGRGHDHRPRRAVDIDGTDDRGSGDDGAAGPADVVVDVQTHFLESGSWGVGFPQGACGEAEPIDCFSAEYWRDLVLTQSDTSVADHLGGAGRRCRRSAVDRRHGAGPGPRH